MTRHCTKCKWYKDCKTWKLFVQQDKKCPNKLKEPNATYEPQATINSIARAANTFIKMKIERKIK